MSASQELGQVFHRVDGTYIDDGSEMYMGMELTWEQWRVVKTTPRGAWLQCVEYPHKRIRFALATGARWVSQTKTQALEGLIARKMRQISIVEHQAETARETLSLAREELAKVKGGAA